MEEIISPKYIMKLIDKLEPLIWKEFSSYKNVRNYINKWHQDDWNFWENFHLYFKDNHNKEIDLNTTLHEMPMELVLQIAIDMWIETPDFIPCIPTFRNDLKENYKTAFDSFDKAFKQVEQNPDLAVTLANSTLESIIKHIMQEDWIKTKINNNKTLYDLTWEILKEFKLFPSKEAQEEIRVIWSWLLSAAKHIEELRSNKTLSHWKTKEDYIIDDPLYAYFIVNSVSTVWLFLMSFYNKKYKKEEEINHKNDEISIDDIPF